MQRFVLILLAIIQIGAARAPSSPAFDERDYENVSLVALLADPQAFHGRKVGVEGFLTLQFEGNGLHLDRQSFVAGIRRNAIWVDQPAWLPVNYDRSFARRYATVYGAFDATEKGHMGLYSGTLFDVQKITPTATASEWQEYILDEKRAAVWRLLRSWILLVGVAVAIAFVFRRLVG